MDYVSIGYDTGLSPTATLIVGETITPVDIVETPAGSGSYRVSFVGLDPAIYDLQLQDGGYIIFQETYLWNGTDVIIPLGGGSPDPSTKLGYLYALAPDGQPAADAVLKYRLVTPIVEGNGWDDEIHEATPNEAGLIQIPLTDGYYEIWLNNGRRKTFKVYSDTADPFAMPQVYG